MDVAQIVTDDGITVSSNFEAEDALRDVAVPDAPVEDKPAAAAPAKADSTDPPTDDAKADDAADRNADGTFKPKPKKGSVEELQANIRRATWEREEEKRQRTAAEERATRAERELAARSQPAQGQPQPQSGPAAQKFVSYEQFIEKQPEATYEDYIDARAEWRYGQLRASERQQEQLAAAQKAEADEITAHSARILAAVTKYTDLHEVMTRGDQALAAAGVSMSPAMVKAIRGSDKSAEITHFLGSHPEVLVQLARESAGIHPSAASVMRRDLESRLSPAPQGSGPAAVPPVTPPIRPIGSSPVAADPNELADDLSVDEHIRRMNAREKRGRR